MFHEWTKIGVVYNSVLTVIFTVLNYPLSYPYCCYPYYLIPVDVGDVHKKSEHSVLSELFPISSIVQL